MYGTHPEIATAAFAPVQVDRMGRQRAGSAPLPRWLPQSAAWAEKVACMYARMLLPRGAVYEGRHRGDCLAALSVFRKPGGKDARAEALWGGLGRAAHADGARAECAAEWIRAHVDL
jgi:hypothetical protein